VGRASPDALFRTGLEHPADAAAGRATLKSLRTGAQLEDAAIALLTDGGAAAVTCGAGAGAADACRHLTTEIGSIAQERHWLHTARINDAGM